MCLINDKPEILEVGDDFYLAVMRYWKEETTFPGKMKELREILSEKDIDPSQVILYIHEGIHGGLGDFEAPNEVPQEVFKGFKSVLVGHYHNRKKIEGTKIEYIGSSRQANFGEDEHKGYTLLWSDGTYSFIENQVNTRYVTFEKDFDELNESALKVISEWRDDDYKIRLKINCTDAQSKLIDKQALFAAGVTKIEAETEETKVEKVTDEDLSKKFDKKGIQTEYEAYCTGKNIKSELGSGEKEDLCSFNGNAQGLRLSHSIQQLNLTFGQYASFMKVPFTVSELLSGQGTGQSSNGVRSDYYSWAYRNAGVYLCEKCLVDKIRECRGTKNRHPFVSIVEWADDLSYVLADLEDAFELGLIDRYDILHMCDKMKQMHELDSMSDLLSHRTVADIFIHEPSEALFYLRDVVANAYINDIAKATCSNIEQFIDQGEPDYSGGDYPGLTIVSMLHDYEKSKIYSCRDVERLEISGGAFLDGLLSAYEKLLYEDTETFQKELSGTGGDPLLKRLACRISRRHREAYIRACTLRDQSEMYARIRLILDYISGMTDTYAQAEYAMISGAGVRSI